MTAPFLAEYITARNSTFHSPTPSLHSGSCSAFPRSKAPFCLAALPLCVPAPFPLHRQLSAAFRLISPQWTFCPPAVHISWSLSWSHLPPLHKDVAEGARGRGGESFCFVMKVVLGDFYVRSRIYTGWDALSALSCFLVAVDNNSNDKPMGWGQKNTRKKPALLWRHQHWPRAFKLGCLPLCSLALGSFVLPSNSSQFVMPLFLATGQASFLCTNSFSSPFYPPPTPVQSENAYR